MSFVSKGVALGVRETLTPTERAWPINSKRSGSLNRIASSQHKDWNLQDRDLVDQTFALIRAQLHGIAVRLGGCATVHTGQITGLSHFPDGDEWLFVKVDRVDLRVHESIRQPHAGLTQ
jgi:hypothetical protein